MNAKLDNLKENDLDSIIVDRLYPGQVMV